MPGVFRWFRASDTALYLACSAALVPKTPPCTWRVPLRPCLSRRRYASRPCLEGSQGGAAMFIHSATTPESKALQVGGRRGCLLRSCPLPASSSRGGRCQSASCAPWVGRERIKERGEWESGLSSPQLPPPTHNQHLCHGQECRGIVFPAALPFLPTTPAQHLCRGQGGG